MVEFRDDGAGEPCLMEVNGRFWGSLALAIASGVDFPMLWVGLLCGERVDPPARYEIGVTVRWLWGDVKRLCYILAGPPPGCPEPYPSVLRGLRELLGSQPAWIRSSPATIPALPSRCSCWTARATMAHGGFSTTTPPATRSSGSSRIPAESPRSP